MEILEATLSFALLMILFSTVATTLTEAVMRIWATRPAVLVKAIRAFLQNDPFFKAHLQTAGAQELEKLTDAMTVNPSLISRIENADGGRFMRWLRALRGPGANRVDRLTTCAFLHRLAKTDAGAKAATLAKAELGDFLSDLSTSFERYMAASNEFFRKRANAVTLMLSVVLAFAVNFESGTVFRHLMDSPETREALLAEATAVTEDNDEALRRLQALLQLPGAKTGDMVPEAQIDNGVLAKEIGEIRQTLDKLDSDMALPLGYANSAFWGKRDDAAPCVDAISVCGWGSSYANWALQVLLAGFLIGLGGPFWYNFYASMSSLLQTLRAFKGAATPETIQPDGKAAGMPVSAQLASAIRDDDRQKLAEVFKTAANTAKARSVGAKALPANAKGPE